MKQIPPLLLVTRRELFSFWSIFWILLITLLYLSLTVLLLNYRLGLATVANNASLTNKLSLFASLFLGIFTAFSPLDTIITLLSALLVGVNIVMLVKTVYAMQQNGRVHLTVGGATFVGLVSTGCSSCGFSILSLVGLGTSFSFLPFHGLELHILSLVLLVMSAWYLLKKLRDSKYCRVK